MAVRTAATPRTADQPPDLTGDTEKAVTLALLDYLRASAVSKVEGAPEPDVRTPGVPSGTNLLGLIRHLTAVERFRFLNEHIGSWPATMKARKTDTVELVLADYRDVTRRANEVIDSYDDLGAPSPTPGKPGRSGDSSMRATLALVIHETARHTGHLDIVREQIDGQTGR